MKIHKCQSMTFSRYRTTIHFRYQINSFGLTVVSDHVRDLGFTFCPSLSPHLHIDTMFCCKALKMLRFLKRILIEFNLSTSFVALYYCFVCYISELNSVVLDPSTCVNSQRIETVQRRFFKYSSFVLKIDCPPHDYQPILQHISLNSLADRKYSVNLSLKNIYLFGIQFIWCY